VLYVQWSSLYSDDDDDDDDDAVTRDEDSDTTATLQTSAATAALATLNMLLLLLALAIIQANDENREHQEPRVCSLTVVVASDPVPNSYALRTHSIDRKNSDFGWAFLNP
jgi:hypothetical protein